MPRYINNSPDSEDWRNPSVQELHTLMESADQKSRRFEQRIYKLMHEDWRNPLVSRLRYILKDKLEVIYNLKRVKFFNHISGINYYNVFSYDIWSVLHKITTKFEGTWCFLKISNSHSHSCYNISSNIGEIPINDGDYKKIMTITTENFDIDILCLLKNMHYKRKFEFSFKIQKRLNGEWVIELMKKISY